MFLKYLFLSFYLLTLAACQLDRSNTVSAVTTNKAINKIAPVMNENDGDTVKKADVTTEVIEPEIVKESVDGLNGPMNDKNFKYCKKVIRDSRYKKLNSSKICKEMRKDSICESVKGRSIFHYEKEAKKNSKGKKILVISLIHGDEVPSGQVSYSWIQRLIDLKSRNTWRVIPMANPDGFFSRTRTNSVGVDINRNFPTIDWEEKALERWRTVKKKDPRKYPGGKANSQPETQCLVKHIDDFSPDFIISIHTPLGVLDFDGPKNLTFPKFKPLPWISLGNYPGSLGRYMWKERSVPVLTIELNNEMAVYNLEKFDKLQDISGTVAIQAIDKGKKKKVTK